MARQGDAAHRHYHELQGGTRMRLGTSLVSVWGSFFERDDSGRLACNRCFLREETKCR